ncbi:hypothetical protein T11_4756 [Trichinella zimbabwensis]|uniref:Uncharacterized protein n=1 Tax=Trichinella zimbabwensis TaxID=268475 RepID=A0A0V1HDM0_9BILA|nr:hypothetical protein T11_4756 [Trichinella zimbabwensis]
MIGLLGRGLRFGSKSGISAGRDLVKKRCIWSACCCEPSQCGAVVATNFRAKLQLELFPATSVLAQWLSSFPSFSCAIAIVKNALAMQVTVRRSSRKAGQQLSANFAFL